MYSSTNHSGSSRQSRVSSNGQTQKDKILYRRITQETDPYINQVPLEAFVSLAVPSQTSELESQLSDSQFGDLKLVMQLLASCSTEGEMHRTLVCFRHFV